MATTYQLISSNVLTSTTASVTFSSIPATYTDLVLRMSLRFDVSGSSSISIRIRFNSDTATNYSITRIIGNGSAALSSRGTNSTSITGGVANALSSTSNTFTSVELYIPNYTSTTNKPASIISAQEDNTTEAYIYGTASLYRNSSALTSMVIDSPSGNLASGSSFYLYGIKNS